MEALGWSGFLQPQALVLGSRFGEAESICFQIWVSQYFCVANFSHFKRWHGKSIPSTHVVFSFFNMLYIFTFCNMIHESSQHFLSPYIVLFLALGKRMTKAWSVLFENRPCNGMKQVGAHSYSKSKWVLTESGAGAGVAPGALDRASCWAEGASSQRKA